MMSNLLICLLYFAPVILSELCTKAGLCRLHCRSLGNDVKYSIQVTTAINTWAIMAGAFCFREGLNFVQLKLDKVLAGHNALWNSYETKSFPIWRSALSREVYSIQNYYWRRLRFICTENNLYLNLGFNFNQTQKPLLVQDLWYILVET